MANNLNIAEVTLAQISDSTHPVNIVAADITGAAYYSRLSVYQPKVVRVTDHDTNDAGETDDPEKMALFESCAHGQPWRADKGAIEHRIWPLAGVAAAPIVVGTNGDKMNIIYPDFDYTTFE